MTGFGKATATYADKTITVELRSLNSKQFDLNARVPGLYREKEPDMRSILTERLGRGKVDLAIFAESPVGEKKAKLNHAIALDYISQVRELEKAAGMDTGPNILKTILAMPDVWQTEYPELEPEEWEAVKGVLVQAAELLTQFRIDEGKQLAADIVARIETIRQLRIEVEGHIPDRLQAVRDRIEKNIREFAEEENTDQNRLEQEIVYYLEKLDITEEHVRLESHCKYFLETMEQATPEVGKKLGFITQELGREINTMGSKANYAPIQRKVVEMKDELEKIKEQLLNIR